MPMRFFLFYQNPPIVIIDSFSTIYIIILIIYLYDHFCRAVTCSEISRCSDDPVIYASYTYSGTSYPFYTRGKRCLLMCTDRNRKNGSVHPSYPPVARQMNDILTKKNKKSCPHSDQRTCYPDRRKCSCLWEQ